MSVRESDFEYKSYRDHDGDGGVAYYSPREGKEPFAFCIEVGGGREKSAPDAWVLVLGDMGYHEITREMRDLILTREDAVKTAEALNETGYNTEAMGGLIWFAVEHARATKRG